MHDALIRLHTNTLVAAHVGCHVRSTSCLLVGNDDLVCLSGTLCWGLDAIGSIYHCLWDFFRAKNQRMESPAMEMTARDALIQSAGQFITCDLDDPNTMFVRQLDVKRNIQGNYCRDTSGNVFYKAACWPIQCEAELRTILIERARLKDVYDQSMGLIYQLANKIHRGEIHG